MFKVWNYLFYLTWRIHCRLINVLIEYSLVHVFNLIPFFRKRWEKGQKYFQEYIYDRDVGITIRYSFSLMTLTTMLTCMFICWCLMELFNINSLRHYFIVILLMIPCVTNYFLLWHSDIYIKYFDIFDKKNNQ